MNEFLKGWLIGFNSAAFGIILGLFFWGKLG